MKSPWSVWAGLSSLLLIRCVRSQHQHGRSILRYIQVSAPYCRPARSTLWYPCTGHGTRLAHGKKALHLACGSDMQRTHACSRANPERDDPTTRWLPIAVSARRDGFFSHDFRSRMTTKLSRHTHRQSNRIVFLYCEAGPGRRSNVFYKHYHALLKEYLWGSHVEGNCERHYLCRSNKKCVKPTESAFGTFPIVRVANN